MTPARDSLSLFQIESELRELMDFRDQEELTPEERVAVNTQIAAYVAKEIAKVDNIRAYMRHCSIMADAAAEEVKLQSARAHSWKQRLEYLKGCCLDAMTAISKKKLEGRTGYIQAKGNGGKQALTIYDPMLIPDDLCIFTVVMSGSEFACLKHLFTDHRIIRMDRTASTEAIRAAMERPCIDCAGGTIPCGTMPCPACNGTGKQIVPGARLEPRGQHIEVR